MPRVSKYFILLVAIAVVVTVLVRRTNQEVEKAPRPSGESPAEVAATGPSEIARAGPQVAPSLAPPPSSNLRAEAPPSSETAGATVRVQVLLVDDETRDPVPNLVAELRSAEATLERLASDEQGWLRSTGTFAPGPYRLDLSSERAPNDLIQAKRKTEAQAFPKDAELSLDAMGAGVPTLELAIPVGPTFRFSAGWPAGLAPGEFTAQLSAADPRQAFDKLFARVRAGNPPWARFSPLARFLSGGPPWGLRVTSEDALWLGTATVESLDKRSLGPIELAFTARGRIVGRLLGPGDVSIPNQWVQAWLPDSSFGNPLKRPVLTRSDAEGRFDLRALEPGRYTLRVEAEGFGPFAGEVEVPALTRVEHDVHLLAPDPGTLGSIRGRLTSRSGTYAGAVRIRLRPNFPPYAARAVDLEWKDVAGSRQAAFEFDRLIAGEYSIVVAPEELVPVVPRKIDTRPSPDLVELSIDDLGERVDVPVQVVADEDGSMLTGVRIDVTLRGRDAQVIAKSGQNEHTAWIRGAPVGATLDLVVHAQTGRQILWRDVVVTSPALPLVLRAKKGFGAQIVVHGPADEPLAGARIFLDDELAGTTDEQGELRVALAKTPTRLRAEYHDWVLAPEGDVLPDTGKLRTEAARVRVAMRPAK